MVLKTGHRLPVSHRYLFFTFLKIGATAFGGFMSLISIIQKQLVEKDNKIENELVLDGISLASVLPGPMAVNVVVYIGFIIGGFSGAMISMLAILLPSFLLVVILSWFYFHFAGVPFMDPFFSGVLPAVGAVILSVSVNLIKKNIKDPFQVLILLISLILLLYIGGFLTTLILLILSGFAGAIYYRKKKDYINPITGDSPGKYINKSSWLKRIPFLVVILVLILVTIIILPERFLYSLSPELTDIRALLVQLGPVSISLFGGGYVFVPILQELVVDRLGWLTTKEFIDGIALGQVTPGPIMITAAFIGYKLAGFWGALTGTIAMFLPPGMVMILCSHFLGHIKNSRWTKKVFQGIHPAVIGMILAACVIIGQTIDWHWIQIIIFALAFIFTYRFKTEVIIIIPVAGLLGILGFMYA